jgi:hypothetical protein
MVQYRRSFVWLAAPLALAACGGAGAPASTPAAAAMQRLQGDWQLIEFHPSLALEAPLQGLLDAQLKSLTITFQSGEFKASGPGVDAGGRYEITSATGDSLTGRIYDRAGAGYGITGQFFGPQFNFNCGDAPWTGSGVLTRAK